MANPAVSYEIDAFHDAEGIMVELEAGQGARGAGDRHFLMLAGYPVMGDLHRCNTGKAAGIVS